MSVMCGRFSQRSPIRYGIAVGHSHADGAREEIDVVARLGVRNASLAAQAGERSERDRLRTTREAKEPACSTMAKRLHHAVGRKKRRNPRGFPSWTSLRARTLTSRGHASAGVPFRRRTTGRSSSARTRNNETAKPFRWTRSADEILQSVERCCLHTSNSGHKVTCNLLEYSYAAGSVNVNVLPTPGVLRTRISPPIPRARFRLIASPRPVPSLELVKLLICTNGSKMSSYLSARIPTPVSETRR